MVDGYRMVFFCSTHCRQWIRETDASSSVRAFAAALLVCETGGPGSVRSATGVRQQAALAQGLYSEV
jgi:hypothetical protein